MTEECVTFYYVPMQQPSTNISALLIALSGTLMMNSKNGNTALPQQSVHINNLKNAEWIPIKLDTGEFHCNLLTHSAMIKITLL